MEHTLVEAIVYGMQAKKAKEINILNLRHIGNSMADYFVICSGYATTQVDAIASAVIKVAHQRTGMYPWKQEGFAEKEWVLIDYVDVIAHVFQDSARAFYMLDTLWGHAPVTRITH